jgi:uncharacterized protein with LGFP repeats
MVMSRLRPVGTSVAAATAARVVGQNELINRRWMEAGGAGAFGPATGGPHAMPDGLGSYHTFGGGTIFYSSAYGAVLISSAIYGKWLALSTAVTPAGNSVRDYLGYPSRDSFGLAGGGEAAYFEGGMIVVRPDGEAFVVYGMTYVKYRYLNDVHGFLGLPIADEVIAPVGGLRSQFEWGDIFWHADTGAAEVHGDIRQHWLMLGGAGGFLGYPLSDEAPVMEGTSEIGRCSIFHGGAVYWSPRTGAAFEVHGDILKAYRDEGGPAGSGGLGFPTSDETGSPGGNRYSNFENGVVVWRGSYDSIAVVSSLDVFVDSFEGFGSDVDLYVYVNVEASTGQRVAERWPADGNWDSSQVIDRPVVSVPVARGDLAIHVRFDGWDSFSVGSDERLGTLEQTYTVDDLWGSGNNPTHRQNNFQATYSVRTHVALDPAKGFRDQLYWPFHNFKTPVLSWDQFALTFSDVDTSEGVVFHPFDHLFYELAYKKMADGGNCFGMCLESIYAQLDQSVYAEPIYRFGPTDGKAPTLMTDAGLIGIINVKHGYQLGAPMLDYFLGEFLLGHTRDPVRTFQKSRDLAGAGDFPLIAMTKSAFGEGHVVRPYEWHDDVKPWEMLVANPNAPKPTNDNDRDPMCVILVDPDHNTWRLKADSSTWSGSDSDGGRLYPIPFHLLSSRPRTPFWEALFALIAGGTLIMLAGDGETEQLTDDAGRTFYEPPGRLAGEEAPLTAAAALALGDVTPSLDRLRATLAPILGPRMGDRSTSAQTPASPLSELRPAAGSERDVRRDPALRIPNLARIPLLSGTAFRDTGLLKQLHAQQLPEVYYMRTLAAPFQQHTPVEPTARGQALRGGDAVVLGQAQAADAQRRNSAPATAGNGHGHQSHLHDSALIRAHLAGSESALEQRVTAAAGGEYVWTICSPAMSAWARAPGGSVDTIRVESPGHPDQRVSLNVPATAVDKQIALGVVGWSGNGPESTRKFELSDLTVHAGGGISAQLDDGGRTLIVHNAGSLDTSFTLRIQTGAAASAVAVRTDVGIASDKTLRFTPSDWAPSAIASAPIHVSVTDVTGAVIGSDTII